MESPRIGMCVRPDSGSSVRSVILRSSADPVNNSA